MTCQEFRKSIQHVRKRLKRNRGWVGLCGLLTYNVGYYAGEDFYDVFSPSDGTRSIYWLDNAKRYHSDFDGTQLELRLLFLEAFEQWAIVNKTYYRYRKHSDE